MRESDARGQAFLVVFDCATWMHESGELAFGGFAARRWGMNGTRNIFERSFDNRRDVSDSEIGGRLGRTVDGWWHLAGTEDMLRCCRRNGVLDASPDEVGELVVLGIFRGPQLQQGGPDGVENGDDEELGAM